MTVVPTRFRLRRDSAADWTSNNPVLLLGEPGIETDTRKIKYGDGATAWNSLAYSAVDLTGALLTSQLDTDVTLAANSDAKVPSQKAVKTYVDAAVTGLLDFKGATNCSANPNYPAALKGDAYVVSAAGKIGGASGVSVEIGDVFVASADNAGGTQASVGTSWFVLEHNLAGALLAADLGVSVQGYDADLAAIAGLSPANDDVLQRKSGAWINRTLAQLKTDLALTEEGTWTPAFSSSGTAPVVTYLNQSGTYRRVGKLMTLFGELYVDTLTPGTGELRISGFPTAPENARYNGTMTVSAALGWTTARPTGGYVHNGGSYVNVTVDTSATSKLDCPATNLAAGALLTFSITYALA